MSSPHPCDFYLRDTRIVARELLGSLLIHEAELGLLTGIIVETEAYLFDDPASHSFSGPTDRNRTMFGPAGHAYIYLSYGIHEMLNAVTAEEGTGEAVLIRAVEPVDGIEIMRRHRNQPSTPAHLLASGPGRLTQAFAIHRTYHNNIDLTTTNSPLRIESANPIPDTDIIASPRIGITKATELPWRYSLKSNKSVSRPPK